jgi:hypothetical protein
MFFGKSKDSGFGAGFLGNGGYPSSVKGELHG